MNLELKPKGSARKASTTGSNSRNGVLRSELNEVVGLLDNLSVRLEPYRPQLEPLLKEGQDSLLDALPVVLSQWAQLRTAGLDVVERMRGSRAQRLRDRLRPKNGLATALRQLADALD